MNRGNQEEQDLIELYTRAEVVASIVWLHGLGASGSDMDGLIANMRHSRQLGLHHLAPNAPLRRITVNDGRPIRAWYDIAGDPADTPEDAAGIEESAGRIERLLNDERRRGIPSSHTVLGGFSQGGAMALHCGLRYAQSLAGIVVLSGELLLADRLAREAHPANRHTPILMIHGTEDETVPLAAAVHSRDRLLAQGYAVEWREFPATHTVPMEALEEVDEWVYQRLADTADSA